MNPKQFIKGERIVPLDGERDPTRFTPADSIGMPHEPSLLPPLPKPDRVSMNGTEASE